MPDVLVVGCGGGGAVLAYELADAGLDVVCLEAGVWHQPEDFTGLEWQMFNTLDGVMRWGPADRSRPAWARVSDGVPVLLQTAGVGGNTVHYIGNSPRAYPESMQDWPISYTDLLPYYEKVEALLPVLEPDTIARRDELFIRGCEQLGIAHTPGRDVSGVGWRLQPNAVSRACTHAGLCLLGCARPEGVPLAEQAKRGTNASYAPMAVATGRCRIETECFATEVLADGSNGGRPRARGVRFRRATGEVEEMEAAVVVLAGGAVETPRLWLNSGLPGDTPVGRYFTLHWPEFIVGTCDEDTDMFRGMQVMTRAEFPGYGFIEPIGMGPLNFALTNFSGQGWGADPVPADHPWRSRGMLVGSALKRRMESYTRSLMITIFVDDEEDPDNRVTLEQAKDPDEHGRIPRVRYRPTPATVERREWLARKSAEVLVAAGCDPGSLHRSNAPPSTIHQHGTMRMGTEPATSVVDAGCEAHQVGGLFIADCSVLTNGIGGPNPTLTCQALATRTAEQVLRRHFGATGAEAARV